MKILWQLFLTNNKRKAKQQSTSNVAESPTGSTLKIDAGKNNNANISSPTLSKALLYRDMHVIDLKLSQHKRPLELEEFQNMWTPFPSQRLADAQIQNMTYVIGSAKMDDEIYFKRDTGLFQCIHEVWINHWNLRTSPEDWWFSVACLISKSLAEMTMTTNGVDNYLDQWALRVRNFLVYNTEKETIAVDIPARTIYEANYEQMFEEISLQLCNSIKVPELVQTMTNDFTTSTASCHKIVSQVNLMSGLQHCFDYAADFTACGIKGVEMLGTQQDWDQLDEKLTKVRQLLEPIKEDLQYHLDDAWWDQTSSCFQNLSSTYRGDTPRVHNFWQDIIIPTKYGNRVNNKYDKGPRTHQVDAFDGWLIHVLTGTKRTIRAQEITDRPEVQEAFHGLNKVPMTVRLAYNMEDSISDTAEIVAGIMGFEMHSDSFNGVPSLQPYHMWAMMLPPNSQLRGEPRQLYL